jgi:hypothetical protein
VTSILESIMDTENYLGWKWDLDNPIHSEDNWEADNKSEIELRNGTKNPEASEQRDESAPLNIP